MNTEAPKDIPNPEAIHLLCEIALYKHSIKVRRSAVVAIYKNIIESLCDDFSSRDVSVCNQVLLHMIAFVRQRNEGGNLRKLLNELNYTNEDLLARYHAIEKQKQITVPAKKVRKILILSRVTVGADIAITSVIVHRLLESFPRASIIVTGPSHLPEIFYGLPRVHWVKFHYDRDGGLLGRLTGWISLYQLLKKEWQGFQPGELLLFDPDSRLSQLGLLPLFNDASYCYFNSRQDQADNKRLSDLTNTWLNTLLNEKRNILPQISIRPAHLAVTRKFFNQFDQDTRKIVVNLGVGNDPKKRLPHPFEEIMFDCLLRDGKTLVVLDSGCHPSERERALLLVKQMKNRSIPAVFLNEKNMATANIPFQHGLVCIQGGIGPLSGLIDQADVFFGYDSCCQHLATARGTRSVICFAGAPNERFFARWRPLDQKGTTTTIRIRDADQLTHADLKNLAKKFCRLLKGGF